MVELLASTVTKRMRAASSLPGAAEGVRGRRYDAGGQLPWSPRAGGPSSNANSAQRGDVMQAGRLAGRVRGGVVVMVPLALPTSAIGVVTIV